MKLVFKGLSAPPPPIQGLEDFKKNICLMFTKSVFSFLGSQDKPEVELDSLKSDPPDLPPKDYFEEIV